MTVSGIELVRKRSTGLAYRMPRPEDGAAVWRLIRSCEPLDENSLYCNLLQCDHFARTCVVAEREDDGAVVGWVSGYILPEAPDTLFVWQVAVGESVQGCGVGKALLAELLEREACTGVRALKTTITADNAASWGLFSSLARSLGAEMTSAPHFRRDAHFDGAHATENMVTVAFAERRARRLAAVT